MITELRVSCCLCEEEHAAEIELPQGWQLIHEGIDGEGGFCPAHSIIAKWADSQCAGCVEGWHDCRLWKDFAHGRRDLDDSDFRKIRRGICPRRTNGTFSVDRSGVHRVDISEQASTESGDAFAQAIFDYWAKFGRQRGR